ncbi:3'-5' exonuclease [Leyella stercorea]|uniref:3'-5' exonuclease n=1 Tax=Leyella stercorea TaxID=363265 RepID=UPI002432DF97|nr:3'-5' exonuclease [Leyella stercorea]
MLSNFTPDACQREVIEAQGGFHLVLASPGCGKTQILTERIRRAHDVEGVAYADMLCLTFTNRAARGMLERINANIADSSVGDVFVGNVHRFCSKFLFGNGLIAAESSVIDEDDAISILARYMGEDEYSVLGDFKRRREYSVIFHLESMMHQIAMGHPKALRTNTDCINADDVKAMQRICSVRGCAFDAAAMVDIYNNVETYRDLTTADTADYGDYQIIQRLLRKMQLAQQYHQYKKQNNLLDFHDLLLFTYDALNADAAQTEYKRYTWVQVDEVQDLNQLQLAIIKLLTARAYRTVMFLGDEQQAIFSFMGAKLDTLTALKQQSACQLHHLSVNHRSPKYLLDIFNTFAAEELHIDPALLPDAGLQLQAPLLGNELALLYSETYEQEVRDCVQFVDRLRTMFPESTTALIVNANRDAEDISGELTRRGIGHFKVSGSDLFSSPELKLLFAHLAVLNNEFNFLAWARLVKGMGVYETNASARNFVRALFDRAILPSDLLRSAADEADGQNAATTYLQRFVRSYEAETIVVFDTETTGLNVFEDDILQIAAVKMRNGVVVPGSEFCVYVETDREIPAMLGDIFNPIIEERKHHTLLSHHAALRMFMEYADGCRLLGHNADYDWHILDHNLRRYASEYDLHESHADYLDSLRLVRLLHPELREHKLKSLLTVLGLEGTNSHLADDDVNATRSVVVHCYKQAKERVEGQRTFLSDARVRQRVDILRRNYGEIYRAAIARLYVRKTYPVGNEAMGRKEENVALVAELQRFYDALLAGNMIQPISGLRYVTAYLSKDMIDPTAEPSLYEQLSNHAMEISTLKEADLCGSSSIDERIFVTTIHKAKGLEFDNVIIFDAVDGRMPNFYSRNNPRLLAEDARKFYVALSRARSRLYISQCIRRYDYRNMPHDVFTTPFMRHIAKYFQSNISSTGQ